MVNTKFVADERTKIGRWDDDYTPTPLAPEGPEDDEAEGRMALLSWAAWRSVEDDDSLFPSMCAR